MARALLLALLIQVGAQNPGVVTGIVRSSSGQPAAGVRVYAMAVKDDADPTATPDALESLVETDATGRYRLEVPPGRYYIASGAVAAPTFYPGTTNMTAARTIAITAGARVEGIDFSSFVPAARSPAPGSFQLPPGSTGVLSGTIRYPDGKPASGVAVSAVSTSVIGAAAPPTSVSANVNVTAAGAAANLARAAALLARGLIAPGTGIPALPRAMTDPNGVFTIQNVPPDTYYVAAGFDDSPVFYPGTPDLAAGKSITTTPTTNLTALDLTIPVDARGVSVSGRVTAAGGRGAAGASVVIIRAPGTSTRLPPGILMSRPPRNAAVDSDGRFEIADVVPGTYRIEAQLSGVASQVQTVVVRDEAVRDIQFYFPVAVLSGRILMQDGSAVPNVQAFNEAIVSTINNPNIVSSTLFPIARDGTFSRVIEADEYRFYLRYLPERYAIRSITAGSTDLLKNPIKIAGTDTVDIDIRVAAAAESPSVGQVKFRGVIRDVASGLPPATAEAVTLCCLSSGPVERRSTPLRADGSFEFSALPPGEYAIGLQVKGQPTNTFTSAPNLPTVSMVTPTIRIGDEGATDVELKATAGFLELSAVFTATNGRTLPASAGAGIVFEGRLSGRFPAEATPTGSYTALVPRGDQYTVVVTPPPGYTIKSIGGAPVTFPVQITAAQTAMRVITIVLEPIP
jgi:hypothetical protein